MEFSINRLNSTPSIQQYTVENRGSTALLEVTSKTQSYVAENRDKFSVQELKELRTEKKMLKARLTAIKEREEKPLNRALRKSSSMIEKIFPNLKLAPSRKSELVQNDYKAAKMQYQRLLQTNPAAIEARKVEKMIKKGKLELSQNKGVWENVDSGFKGEFEKMASKYELFGDVKSFLAPTSSGDKNHLNSFLDDIALGLEQIQSSKALRQKDIKWIHGTRSPAVGVMLATDHTLHPTGHLLKNKIYPLSGELQMGILGEGVNKDNLSGTSHSRLGVKTTIEYATDYKETGSTVWSKLSQKQIRSIYDDAIKLHKKDPEMKSTFGQGTKLDVLTSSIYLERAKIIDPDFSINSAELRSQLDQMIKEMPDDCPEIVSKWLVDLRSRCDSPPFISPTDQLRNLVGNSFPIVLGTTSREGASLEGGGFLDEFVVKGGVNLNEMAVAFTNSENVQQLQKLFNDSGLKIEVMDFNALKASAIDSVESNHPENIEGKM